MGTLIYIICLKRNVLTPAFFSEEGHLVLIPIIISVSLGKLHCVVLVFITGFSRGLCPRPFSSPPPSALYYGFHCVYKTSANKLTFFLPIPSSEVYCPILFKAWTEPVGHWEGVGGGAEKKKPRPFTVKSETLCFWSCRASNSLCGHWSVAWFGGKTCVCSLVMQASSFVNGLCFCQKFCLEWQALQGEKRTVWHISKRKLS